MLLNCHIKTSILNNQTKEQNTQRIKYSSFEEKRNFLRGKETLNLLGKDFKPS